MNARWATSCTPRRHAARGRGDRTTPRPAACAPASAAPPSSASRGRAGRRPRSGRRAPAAASAPQRTPRQRRVRAEQHQPQPLVGDGLPGIGHERLCLLRNEASTSSTAAPCDHLPWRRRSTIRRRAAVSSQAGGLAGVVVQVRAAASERVGQPSSARSSRRNCATSRASSPTRRGAARRAVSVRPDHRCGRPPGGPRRPSPRRCRRPRAGRRGRRSRRRRSRSAARTVSAYGPSVTVVASPERRRPSPCASG